MTLSRREFFDFLKATCAVAAMPGVLTGSASSQSFVAVSPKTSDSSEAIVNDIHSQLNATRVSRVIKPLSSSDLRATILTARAQGKAISISGGRHSMGAQQFGTGTILVDMTGMNRVLNLDAERGVVEVEAGIEWPQLLDYLMRVQTGREMQPRREPRAVSARDWRLRSVWDRDFSAAAVVGTQEGATHSRDSRHERHHSVLRAANLGRVLVRRLPVRDRQQPRQLSAAWSLLVLSPGRSGDTAHREPYPVSPGRLGAADLLFA